MTPEIYREDNEWNNQNSLIKRYFRLPLQLMKVLRNTSFELNGMQMSFDSSGNPDLGYILVEWFWENGTFKSKTVGQFVQSLYLNESLLEWHTDDNQVMSCFKMPIPNVLQYTTIAAYRSGVLFPLGFVGVV